MDNFDSEKYAAVDDKFLNFHPDGNVRDRRTQPSEHKAHKRKKSCGTKSNCLFLIESQSYSHRVDETADNEEDDDSDSEFLIEDIDQEEMSDSSETSSSTLY